MGIAWVIPSERQLFNLFSEVITVDTTASTNNELRPLLIISAKDSSGKMFTVLRAFLPNEQAWVFRWIFSAVLPKMFGLSKLNDVKLIISDGDSQEMQQIDTAITKYFPQAYRARCGWHIVEMGWQNHMLTSSVFPKEKREKYYMISDKVKGWMYSWMKPMCESKEEYELSKALLIQYVKSDYVPKI